MKKARILIVLVICALTLVSGGQAAIPAPGYKIGSKIDVAVTANDESNPAVAYCASSQYLVVYELEGGIYGQRLEEDGTLLGSAFVIFAGYASDPDVACNWNRDRFIVLWGYDFYGGARTVDVHIRRLRSKIEEQDTFIETVRNVGYRFRAAP